jgi:hypothetical protein
LAYPVDQVLVKRTATAHTFTSPSELVASQLWVLGTLTTKLSVVHLQVLHLQSQVLHLLKQGQDHTQEEN